jgi:hypothetical protein
LGATLIGTWIFVTVVTDGKSGSKFSDFASGFTSGHHAAMPCHAMPLSVNVGGRIFQASEDSLRRCGQFVLRAYFGK